MQVALCLTARRARRCQTQLGLPLRAVLVLRVAVGKLLVCRGARVVREERLSTVLSLL